MREGAKRVIFRQGVAFFLGGRVELGQDQAQEGVGLAMAVHTIS